MWANEGDARVDIQIVARGDSARLRACIESLVAHESATTFTITCVVNPVDREQPVLEGLPAAVTTLPSPMNLGWAGGLHLARAHTSAEYLVFAQDDMTVAPGWLDALLAVADRYPEAGAVGSVEVDAVTRIPNGTAGGYAVPADDIARWNETDVLRAGTYEPGTPLDWITSKGMLTRRAAFDDVRGTDARLFPLNHVDKDYSTHLRAHGWTLVLAPDAHLFHKGHRSAPVVLRQFLAGWQEPTLNARWAETLRLLPEGAARSVPHECSPWTAGDVEAITRVVALEASVMLVPMVSFFAAREHDLTGQLVRSEAVRHDVMAELVATQGHYAERAGELERLLAAYRDQTEDLARTQESYRERDEEAARLRALLDESRR